MGLFSENAVGGFRGAVALARAPLSKKSGARGVPGVLDRSLKLSYTSPCSPLYVYLPSIAIVSKLPRTVRTVGNCFRWPRNVSLEKVDSYFSIHSLSSASAGL